MRQGDKRASRIGDGQARKVPASRRKRLFAGIPMHDAEVRAAVEEHSLAALRALEHRRGAIRQLRLDDERAERFRGGRNAQ